MRYRVKKTLSSQKEDGKIYRPGDTYTADEKKHPYEIEMLTAMGVIEPLKDEPTPSEKGKGE